MSHNDIIQKVGISLIGYSDAIQNVVLEVNRVTPVQWFEVLEQRGRINSEGNVEFQVVVRIAV